MTNPQGDQSDQDSGDPGVRSSDHEDRRERSRRADPDAPGNYVDDNTSTEVPEPNEPA